MTHQLPDELREPPKPDSSVDGEISKRLGLVKIGQFESSNGFHQRDILGKVLTKSEIEHLARFIATHTAKAVEDTAKAYGGCTDCYGKGYATVNDRWAGHDTDTDIGSPGGYISGGDANAMKFCKCNRGKQLKAQVGKAVEAATNKPNPNSTVDGELLKILEHVKIGKFKASNGFHQREVLGAVLTTSELRYLASFIATQVAEARQQPVGDAVEVKVAPDIMRYVLGKCKQSDRTIASRLLVPERFIGEWRNDGAELEIWRLKVLASLTKRYNWTIFLLKDLAQLTGGHNE